MLVFFITGRGEKAEFCRQLPVPAECRLKRAQSDHGVVRLGVCVVLCLSIRGPGRFPAILLESRVSLKGQEGRTVFPTA